MKLNILGCSGRLAANEPDPVANMILHDTWYCH